MAAPGPESGGARGRSAGLNAAVRSTALMTLASRVGGLARDVLIGRIFGDTALNSAFQAAFAVPNMFRRLFGEGALSAAFIPEYTKAHKEDEGGGAAGDRVGGAGRLASLTIWMLALVTTGLTLIAEVVLLAWLMWGQHGADRRLLLELLMVMLPFMPLICMVAILAGMLQVHGRFAAAASGPLMLNGFIIAVGVWSVATGQTADQRIAFAIGICTVLSAVTQLIWFFRLLKPHVRWTINRGELRMARERGRTMMKKFVPVAIGLGTLQLNTFIDTALATFPIWFQTARKGIPFPLDVSSNAILAQTSRLYQFPLGVFGIAVASAAFPLLARHADDPHAFTHTLRRSLRLSLFIGLPATLGLILTRHELTGVLFGHGKVGFSPEGVARSALVLLGFAPGVWAYSLNHVLTRGFYARGDTKTPMKVSIAMMLLNITLNFTLIWWLREAGMAWATSTAAVVQTLVLLRLARARLCDGPVLDGPTISGFSKIAIASVAMFAGVWAVRRVVIGTGSTHAVGWTNQLIHLAILSAAGMAIYGGLAVVLKIRELRWLVSGKGE